MKKIILMMVVIVVLGILTGLGVVYSGIYNVAASESHSEFTQWLLHTTMQNSVERRTGSIQIPSDLESQERLYAGVNDYQVMCAGCHIPPGNSQTPMAKGLNPSPPDLKESAEHMSPQEMFWIVKHGIRMTGMPGWGETHSDEDLWSVIAFTRQLPEMSPDEYKALKENAKGKGGHHDGGDGHEHSQGGNSVDSGDSDSHGGHDNQDGAKSDKESTQTRASGHTH